MESDELRLEALRAALQINASRQNQMGTYPKAHVVLNDAKLIEKYLKDGTVDREEV